MSYICISPFPLYLHVIQVGYKSLQWLGVVSHEENRKEFQVHWLNCGFQVSFRLKIDFLPTKE